MSLKSATTPVPEFLMGGGELGQMIREFDWSSTSLGPVDTWPHSLRTCVQIMLNSRQPIWIGWGKELIKLYNDPYKTIVRGKHPEALGAPASVVWKDIWKDIEPMLNRVMHDNEGTYVEEQLLIMERNGYPEETYYTFSYTPVAGDKGGTEGMICANTDDTERIIAGRQLGTLTKLGNSLSEAKSYDEVLRHVMMTLHTNPFDFTFSIFYELKDGIAILTHINDLQGLPSSIDLALAQPLSQKFSSAMMERKYQVIDEMQQYFSQAPSTVWSIPSSKAIILPIAQRGQKSIYGFLVVGLNPYRLLDGKYLGFLNLIADQVSTSMTTVHAFEEERKRVEALAEIDRAKTTFFSNISHEFRTPLTLMLGPMEDLLNSGNLKAEEREKTQLAFRNGIRMQKLVNLLLDFSRIEAGRMEADFAPVDLATITEDLASNFRSAVERAGMQLIITREHIDEPVYVDVDMWEKIMLNLLSNAFKYSEKGRIEVSIAQRDGCAEVSVTDTGVGIPEDELAKIFDRFHRVQNVKGRSQEGTGIGLAMVKELVRLHHGKISVESKLNVGSKFTIQLPMGSHPPVVKRSTAPRELKNARAYVDEALQWIPVKGNGATLPKSNSKDADVAPKYTILLADDNADMRMYVQRLFDKDYRVIVVADGEEAYSVAKENVPDLILSDIMMPRLDGFGLLKKLRANLATKNIPVIFLSARAGDEAKVEGLVAGADDYLTKPFSSKELVARVNNQISISTTRRKTEKEFFNLFLQAPAHIHVFKGPEHVVEFFHPLGIAITGKDITGMKIREALPELESQGHIKMLDEVYQQGRTVRINEVKANFIKDGVPADFFFNVTYLPWRDLEDKIQGVLQFTFDVTEAVQLRVKSESNERKFRNIAQQSPVAMALLMGPEHIVEVANEKVLALWGKQHDEVINKPVLSIFPEIIAQGFKVLLGNVFRTGEPFIATELPITFVRDGREENVVVNLLYEPFRNERNEIEGIVAVGTDVTEQVNARERIAQAELKFRTIIEQTPSPLCIFKGEEMILEVANDAALAVWQVGREVVGRRLVEIVPEMSRQPFLELMLDVFHNGITRFGYEAHAYFLRPDGKREERFFNFVYVPFRDVDEEISGVLVLASDVTEQVDAKKQLVENEERLRIATDILELGTWEYDPLNKHLVCSENTLRIFGFEATPQRFNDFFELIAEEDKERVTDAFAAALDSQSIGRYDLEYSITNKINQSIRHIRASGQTFFNSDGKAYRFIGTVLDITERKKSEDKLIASESRFRLLATSVPQIVWTTDKNGKTNYISGQFERFTGLIPETSHESWQSVLHPDDRNRVLNKRSAAIRDGTGWNDEFRLLNVKTQQYNWFQGNSQPLMDAKGEIGMWIGSASDIQDLKELSNWLEQQVQERTRALKELNQSLKLSNEDLQQFAHVASHDLKEPIRKIKTYSNRLRDDYSNLLPEKGSNFLNKILNATDRMYSMVDGVLSYSTMAAVHQVAEPVDLNEILASIQDDLEVLIQDKNAMISCDPLPTVTGAPVLLHQLFYNLLNNSIKFAKSDEPSKINITSGWIDIEGRKFARIVLTDNGIGFEQDHADKIFTTFTRLNSKDRYEGTGLGLALCKKIVQRHGGFITAKGEPGVGAEFTVLLPVNA